VAEKGWTHIEMAEVNTELLVDACTTPYCEIAPKKLSLIIRPNE